MLDRKNVWLQGVHSDVESRGGVPRSIVWRRASRLLDPADGLGIENA